MAAAAVATPTFHDLWRPRANPWAIAVTVTLATFMEALDSSIAAGALPRALRYRFRCAMCGDCFTLQADMDNAAGGWSRDT